ncbi:peroxide stress protein YaaA [Microbacterium sp.]|uniref:YaaA family protein n=1 Tax=Microbacterium sp. TaxID=51671 RepID=UPI002812092E|nr:peroxide stress protein YaaA [Microbacterium sp.]
MKILLPPSETKRSGGSGAPLDLPGLALPSLYDERQAIVDALIRLADDEEASRRVLKLSDRQLEDILHNRMLCTAATMPAVDRYTGVLFDALDAASLPPAPRRWLGAHVWIHSAPFGPVGALDRIPAYRLAAGTSLPGVPALRRHWAEATSAAIAAERPGFVLDLRSEAYVALGPIATTVTSAYIRVVTDDGESSRALNHFNKRSKGELVRALAEDRPRIRSLRGLLDWSTPRGIILRPTVTTGVIELVVRD